MPAGSVSASIALSRSMCSSRCLALGAPGGWRSQTSVLTLLFSRRFSSASSRPLMLRRQGFGQRGVDAPRGARDRLGTDPLDDIDRRQQDRLATQVPDQRAGQHDALVGLPRQVVQAVHREPVVPHGERPEAEHGLQFDQVLPACLVAPAVLGPAFRWRLRAASPPGPTGARRVVRPRPGSRPGSACSRAGRRTPTGWPHRDADG